MDNSTRVQVHDDQVIMFSIPTHSFDPTSAVYLILGPELIEEILMNYIEEVSAHVAYRKCFLSQPFLIIQINRRRDS